MLTLISLTRHPKNSYAHYAGSCEVQGSVNADDRVLLQLHNNSYISNKHDGQNSYVHDRYFRLRTVIGRQPTNPNNYINVNHYHLNKPNQS